MAGGGSIAGMIISIRNNARLLRKKRMFKRDSSFLNAKKELFKAAEGKIDIRKATTEELKKVRQQIAQNRKATKRNFAIAILISLPIFYVIGRYFYKDYSRGVFFEKAIKESELAKKNKEYLFYINDGDRYLREKHWSNAIFQYKAAVYLFPNEYDARYRLAIAYSYSCRNDNSNCDKGRELADKLLKAFPKNKDLKKLTVLFNDIKVLE